MLNASILSGKAKPTGKYELKMVGKPAQKSAKKTPAKTTSKSGK